MWVKLWNFIWNNPSFKCVPKSSSHISLSFGQSTWGLSYCVRPFFFPFCFLCFVPHLLRPSPTLQLRMPPSSPPNWHIWICFFSLWWVLFSVGEKGGPNPCWNPLQATHVIWFHLMCLVPFNPASGGGKSLLQRTAGKRWSQNGSVVGWVPLHYKNTGTRYSELVVSGGCLRADSWSYLQFRGIWQTADVLMAGWPLPESLRPEVYIPY